MRCAKREPGRSWEALESELNKLGEPVCTLLDLPACDSYQPALSATMRCTNPAYQSLRCCQGTQHVMSCNDPVLMQAHPLLSLLMSQRSVQSAIMQAGSQNYYMPTYTATPASGCKGQHDLTMSLGFANDACLQQL